MSQQRPRAPRTTIPSPSTGTLGAAVAVVALVLGFLILRDVRSDGVANVTPGTAGSEQPTDSVVDPNATTTTAAFNIQGFKIQVANSSGIALSAGKMTTDLQAQGYVVQPALNVPEGTAKRQKTGVFYLAGCETAAQNVASVLGGNVDVAAMPSPVPVEGGSLKEACILILLGTDLAGKPLAGVVGSGSGLAATTTVPPAG